MSKRTIGRCEGRATAASSRFVDWRGKALQRQDWDFHGCPKSQLFCCLEYERIRELVCYRQWAARWKREHGAKVPGSGFVLGTGFDECLPWFPDTPWPLIPEDARKRAVNQFPGCLWLGIVGETSPEGLKLKDGTLSCSVTRVVGDHAVSTFAFQVSWSFNDTYLTKAFGEWVRYYRNRLREAEMKGMEPSRKPGQRGRPPKEILRYIGLRRVVYAYRPNSVERLAALAPGFKYQEMPAVWRAVGKANQWLNRSTELDWPEA